MHALAEHGCITRVSPHHHHQYHPHTQDSLKAALAILVAYFKFELATDKPGAYKEAAGLTLGVEGGSLPLVVSSRY